MSHKSRSHSSGDLGRAWFISSGLADVSVVNKQVRGDLLNKVALAEMIQLSSTCFSQNSNELTQFTQASPHHEGRIREQESTPKSTELVEAWAGT